MTEKLKYKVGDKVLVEAEVIETYKGIGDLRDQIEGFDIKMSSKIIMPKPKIPQAVMECWERHKDDYWSLDNYLSSRDVPDELDDWLLFSADKLKNQHALAALIAYGPEAVEVEKEKRYRVMIKRISQILCKQGDSLIFTLPNPFDEEDGKYLFTKQELIDAGFEGVFDNPMFEVEEVE